MSSLFKYVLVGLTLIAGIFCPGAPVRAGQPGEAKMYLKPVVIEFDERYRLEDDTATLSLQSLDPSGQPHMVIDFSGNGQWQIENAWTRNSLEIQPSSGVYAGPLQVVMNGRVIDFYSQNMPGSRNLVLVKVLNMTMPDGMELNVHYTDFSIEKSGDTAYPYRVLRHMRNAYEILKTQMDFVPKTAGMASVDIYLGDAEGEGPLPFSGFNQDDFKRAPLFLIQKDFSTGKKHPAILLPADYKKFLEFWRQINRIPGGVEYPEDRYLASSVIHEMTHAIVHTFNENLGSTEHIIHNGDWYTEGLARYYEMKAGSDAGFASEGFRMRQSDKIKFSRGGANYYLRFPDENFFGLRYENCLFWLYFEQRFGRRAVVRISRELDLLPFEATPAMYARSMQKVTGVLFEEMLDDYFNWLFKGKYHYYPGCENLLPVAVTRTVWSGGKFFAYTRDGRLIKRKDVIDFDWVAGWGDHDAKDGAQCAGGDMTRAADIRPLAFDAHEIMISRDHRSSMKLTLRNKGDSASLRATLYTSSALQDRTVEYHLRRGQTIEFSADSVERVTKISLVLSNLDSVNKAEYEIKIDTDVPILRSRF